MGLKRDLKRVGQDIEAKAKTAQDKAEGKPELIKVWNKIKEDEHDHLPILREHLVKEVKNENVERNKLWWSCGETRR